MRAGAVRGFSCPLMVSQSNQSGETTTAVIRSPFDRLRVSGHGDPFVLSVPKHGRRGNDSPRAAPPRLKCAWHRGMMSE